VGKSGDSKEEWQIYYIVLIDCLVSVFKSIFPGMESQSCGAVKQTIPERFMGLILSSMISSGTDLDKNVLAIL